MDFHDPRRLVELLRNHLATHDQPLSFLFGAGTSASINIAPPAVTGAKREHKPLVPAIVALTDQCRTVALATDKLFGNAWDLLINECVTNKLDKNIESILSRIQHKISALGDGEKSVGLDRSKLTELEGSIRKTIATIANPSTATIPDLVPHDHFARWIKQASRKYPIEIFTTNYDVLIERSLENARVPTFDGFIGSYEPVFYPESFENEKILPPRDWVRIWKIHGSINWQIRKTKAGSTVVRTKPGNDGEMILPSHLKYDESRKLPYLALLDRLNLVLSRNAGVLLISGYSFGDQHINTVIFDALDNFSLKHVIALQHSDISQDDSLVQKAIARPNLMLIAPNAAVIGAQWGVWKLVSPIAAMDASFMDLAFDSDAFPESASPALTGRVMLGDFSRFCVFLRTMER